ncbi:MAG TPA: PQQ-binding-like beta-propeller repeat protein [Candidatus Acidoferrales bacterium]|nr:PQQ-binding-like beta-propeller repeat protein [Candidatus Acidoferrales bacterium]
MKQVLQMDVGKATLLGLGVGAILIVGALVRYELVARQASRESAPTIPQKWQFATAGAINGALALGEDGTLYAASEDGFVYALDPSGKLQWQFESGPVKGAPAIGADGAIYVTNQDQRVIAINRTGTQRWAVGGGPYADKQTSWLGAALDENHLYTPWRGQFRAYRLSDGSTDWSAGVGFERAGSAAIFPNGVIVYSGVGRVDAVWSGGRTIWQYPVMNPPLTVDMITRTGGRIPPGNFWPESGFAVGYTGTFYVCAAESRLVALATDGSYKWEFKTKTHVVNHATPLIAADGTVYFASGDGNLYALNPDGTQKWVLNTVGSISETPALAADGALYVLNSGWLMAVSSEGKVLEKVAINEGPGSSSPTLAPDGTIYVGLRGGKIIAFAGTHGALMDSAWPKFQRDLANSGRARPI